jgi:hypothetical protein
MDAPLCCAECGADWSDGQTCTGHFHRMGFWELDHQLYDVHHLMVLCYHLQHPSLYAPDGLAGAKKLLVAFVEEGVTPQAMRQRIRKAVDSGVRGYKIKGTPDSCGAYAQPPEWEMVAADVVRAGISSYYASVRKWAELTLKALRESGNLDS